MAILCTTRSIDISCRILDLQVLSMHNVRCATKCTRTLTLTKTRYVSLVKYLKHLTSLLKYLAKNPVNSISKGILQEWPDDLYIYLYTYIPIYLYTQDEPCLCNSQKKLISFQKPLSTQVSSISTPFNSLGSYPRALRTVGATCWVETLLSNFLGWRWGLLTKQETFL